MSKRFQVALSFPGEHRTVVEQIANVLAERLTKPAVFYDRFYESELARPNLDTYLQNIYHNDSELIVVFLCQDYNHKEWCHLEARAIRDLIKKRRDDEVMFIRLDDGDVDGVFSVDGYVDAKGRPAREIAQVVIDRLDHARGHKGDAPPHQPSVAPVRVRIGDLPTRHGKLFVDRVDGLAFLDRAWADPQTHIAELVAFGGVGKTRLLLRWLKHIASRGYDGATRVLAHSFYAQGQGYDTQSSSDAFLDTALKFFGDPDPALGSPREKGERLASLVRKERTLLILDGTEPLQYSPTSDTPGRIRDPGLAQLVRDLAMSNSGLCVISTRVEIEDIDFMLRQGSETDGTVDVNRLDMLPDDAGARLLAELGVQGSDEELKAASREVKGHALTLTLLGNYLRFAHEGGIQHLSEIGFAEIDQDLSCLDESQGPACRIMQKYESWFGEGRELSILRLLALFDRPAAREELDELRARPLIEGLTDALVGLRRVEWNRTVSQLRDLGLLSQRASRERDAELDTHPLIREYFAEQLAEKLPDAARAGHARLYEYLKQKVPQTPASVEDVVLLCRAVRHGCEAGLVQDSFDDLIKQRIIAQGLEFLYGRNGVAPSLVPALRQYFADSFTGAIRLKSSRDQVDLLYWSGHCLASAAGFGTDPVPHIFERLREIAIEYELAGSVVSALIGLFYCRQYRAEMFLARSIAEDMKQVAGRADNPALSVTARQVCAETEFYLGRFSDCYETAQLHLTSGSPQDQSLIPLYDPWVGFLGWRTWSHLYLGRPGQAIEDARAAVKRATEPAEPRNTLKTCHTNGLALFYAAVVHFENGDASRLREMVHKLREFASGRQFSFYTALTQIMDGAAHLLERTWAASIKELKSGTTKWVRIGNLRGLTRYYCILAQAQLGASDFAETEKSLASAFFYQHDGEQFYLAELHRVRAELLRRRDPLRAADVDSEYRKALHVADGQQAWMLKVRAALGYHDFTQEHGGDVDEAIRILDDAYQRCDPSYMTRDFRAAERILNS